MVDTKEKLQEAYAVQIRRKEEEINKLNEKNKMLMKTSLSLSQKLLECQKYVQKLEKRLKFLERWE